MKLARQDSKTLASDWRGRVAQLRQVATQLNELSGLTFCQLSECRSDSLAKLKGFEELESLAREAFRAECDEVAEIKREVAHQTAIYGSGLEHRDELMSSIQAMQTELTESTEELGMLTKLAMDSQKLTDLRKTVKELRSDVTTMDVEIGVLLWQVGKSQKELASSRPAGSIVGR